MLQLFFQNNILRLLKFIIFFFMALFVLGDVAFISFIAIKGDNDFLRVSQYAISYIQKNMEFEYNNLEFMPPVRYETLESQKIPKIINYVWLGSEELPKDVQKTIETWKKFAPDYEIKRWNEESCDINSNDFLKYTYEHKYYDNASDFCRMKALEQNGGVYFDTDHHLTKPLKLPASEVVLVQEYDTGISGSFMASVPHHPFFKAMLDAKNWPVTDKKYFLTVQDKLLAELKNFYHIYNIPFSGISNESLTVFTPNYYMFDYGGGENRAIHLHGAGYTKYAQNSLWYKTFYKSNLDNVFYHLGGRTLIPLENGEVYDYETKEKFHIQITKDKDIIHLQDENFKSLGFYYCSLDFCLKMFKAKNED